MKRSEIIKELMSTIGAYDSWSEQCEYMLRICEDAGMLPPYSEKIEEKEYKIKSTSPEYSLFYKWEEE